MATTGACGTASTEDDVRPNMARVYDVLVGGTDNEQIDREFVAEIEVELPNFAAVIRELWSIGRRSVAHLAAQGFDQFLELGSGLPTVRPVHEVAAEQGVRPRVVYVDHDPETAAHARRLVAGVDGTAVVRAVVEDTTALLEHPDVRATLDFGRPVAVLAHGILHYLDDDAATAMVGALTEATVPGSRLAIAHMSRTGRPEAQDWAHLPHRGVSYAPRMREPADMMPWLAGWEVLPPGWTAASAWDPGARSGPTPAETNAAYWAAHARLR